MLTKARDLIEQDRIDEACTVLNNTYLSSDGVSDPFDLIKGTAKPGLNDMIFDLIGVLDCP